MTDTPAIVINTSGLSKAFGNVQALEDLNLRVPKNSIFGFLGPNGAGKTTTTKLLLGQPLPSLSPLLWTAGFSILFLVIGVWKFKRAEL